MNYSRNISLLKSIDMGVTANNTALTELNKKKIIFNARMTDGTNEYLATADYTSSPTYFYWQNDKNVPVYITRYTLLYPVTTEPTWNQLYHTGAWDSKIGLLNEAETDIEEPYVTVKDNYNFMLEENANHMKRTQFSTNIYAFELRLDRAPVEIGVTRKFAQYIAGDIDFDEAPRGLIEGYYYAS